MQIPQCGPIIDHEVIDREVTQAEKQHTDRARRLIVTRHKMSKRTKRVYARETKPYVDMIGTGGTVT